MPILAPHPYQDTPGRRSGFTLLKSTGYLFTDYLFPELSAEFPWKPAPAGSHARARRERQTEDGRLVLLTPKR